MRFKLLDIGLEGWANPFKHRCKMVPIATQSTKTEKGGSFFFMREGKQVPGTLVLIRCACGKVETPELIGEWTLEQVSGVNVSSVDKLIASTK